MADWSLAIINSCSWLPCRLNLVDKCYRAHESVKPVLNRCFYVDTLDGDANQLYAGMLCHTFRIWMVCSQNAYACALSNSNFGWMILNKLHICGASRLQWKEINEIWLIFVWNWFDWKLKKITLIICLKNKNLTLKICLEIKFYIFKIYLKITFFYTFVKKNKNFFHDRVWMYYEVLWSTMKYYEKLNMKKPQNT